MIGEVISSVQNSIDGYLLCDGSVCPEQYSELREILKARPGEFLHENFNVNPTSVTLTKVHKVKFVNNKYFILGMNGNNPAIAYADSMAGPWTVKDIVTSTYTNSTDDGIHDIMYAGSNYVVLGHSSTSDSASTLFIYYSSNLTSWTSAYTLANTALNNGTLFYVNSKYGYVNMTPGSFGIDIYTCSTVNGTYTKDTTLSASFAESTADASRYTPYSAMCEDNTLYIGCSQAYASSDTYYGKAMILSTTNLSSWTTKELVSKSGSAAFTVKVPYLAKVNGIYGCGYQYSDGAENVGASAHYGSTFSGMVALEETEYERLLRPYCYCNGRHFIGTLYDDGNKTTGVRYIEDIEASNDYVHFGIFDYGELMNVMMEDGVPYAVCCDSTATYVSHNDSVRLPDYTPIGHNMFIAAEDTGSGSADAFKTMTWDKISEICKAGKAANYFKVGDKRTVTIGGVNYDIDIIGINHDNVTDSTTYGREKAGITCQLSSALPTTYEMSTEDGNTCGWSGSYVRSTALPAFLATLPSELSSVLVAVDKKTVKCDCIPAVVNTTSDTLFIPGYSEVFDYQMAPYGSEGEQYEWYSLYNTKTKCVDGVVSNWWLRSMNVGFTSGFWSVAYNGAAWPEYSTTELGVVPCFCI